VKKIIIVSPHFPPSNLAAVHRSRLFAQHLPFFGWEPIIVTVHEKYYEETLDPILLNLLPKGLRIEKTEAIRTKPIRLIGDIGIRGFKALLDKILSICAKEKIDFLFIPIPSNFTAMLGNMVYKRTGIPFGIDYIDPWVHIWPGSETLFSKAWFSRKLGEILEPIAVKNASLITGVAPGYYADVLERNPHLKDKIITAAMPYGGETLDHEMIEKLGLTPYLFQKQVGTLDFVYAGAMLPKAYKPLEEVLKTISKAKATFKNIRFHFIGSGSNPNDPFSYNVKPLAEKYDLWQTIIFEYPKRIPYLDVLTHLNASDGTFILGSTEPHYTPSKVYQSVLSEKAIFAILHQQSTASKVIEETGAGIVLDFDGEDDISKISDVFLDKWNQFIKFSEHFTARNINREAFESYSAKNVTKTLADALDAAIELKGSNSKKAIIIAPYFPPSNSADMHRVRMSLPYYKELGWHVEIVTLHPKHIDVSIDEELVKTIPKQIKVHYVDAFLKKITIQFGLGSLAIRSLLQYKRKVNEILSTNQFDLIYFSTTHFPLCILGRYWKKKWGIPYVIDMQDPWHTTYYKNKPKDERPRKYWFSYRLNRYLEPIAMKECSGLISVSQAYLTDLNTRYPHLNKIPQAVITFGYSDSDLHLAKKSRQKSRLQNIKKQLVYIGVLGPMMKKSLEIFFAALEKSKMFDDSFYLSFRGTSYADPSKSKKTAWPLVKKYKLEHNISETTARLGMFDTLNALNQADGLVIIGTDDNGYTSSKLYPYLQANKPILAILNEKSSAFITLKSLSNAFVVGLTEHADKSEAIIEEYLNFILEDKSPYVNQNELKRFEAKNLTENQTKLFDKVITKKNQ